MSDGTKLDAIADQLGDLRVTLADVAGDVRAVLGRLKDHDRTDADHEARIRVLEQIGANEHATQIKEQAGRIDGLLGQIQKLKEWRAKVVGAAAAVGALIGGGVGAGIEALLRASSHQ